MTDKSVRSNKPLMLAAFGSRLAKTSGFCSRHSGGFEDLIS